MVFSRAPLPRFSWFGSSTSHRVPPVFPFFKTPQKPAYQLVRTFTNVGANDSSSHYSLSIPTSMPPPSNANTDPDPNPDLNVNANANANASRRWRPMCLYHAQGKCTRTGDPIHLERFVHDCNMEFPVNAADLEHKRLQDFDFFLVFDLEGKVEILEFPVLMIDAKTMAFVDLFHRFVRPSAMSEQRINEYVANKYGKFGVDRVWHDTALPFNEVLTQFEDWLSQHHLWENKHDGHLNQAAFVTCGNWDVKTQVPRQCKISKMKLPPYFMEWINIKDVYQNFYKPKNAAKGMRTMMEQLKIPMLGSHHLGIDDTKNITRVLLRMLSDGAVMQITARRHRDSPGMVNFLFKDRIM